MVQQIFRDDFEDNYTRWTDTVLGGDGAVARSQVRKHHGNWSSLHSLKTNGSSARVRKILSTTYTFLYLREYVMFETLPLRDFVAVGPRFAKEPGTETLGFVIVNGTTSKFGVMNWHLSTKSYETNTTPLYPYVWYCLELYWLRNTTAGAYRLWVDGMLKVQVTGVDTGDNNIDGISANMFNGSGGDEAATRRIWIDCVRSNTTYIGPERNPIHNVGFAHSKRNMGFLAGLKRPPVQ